MRQEETIGYESIKKEALEQFRSGKSLTGKGGAFAPLFKQFLEATPAVRSLLTSYYYPAVRSLQTSNDYVCSLRLHYKIGI